MNFTKNVVDKVRLLGFNTVEDFVKANWDDFSLAEQTLFELGGICLQK